MSDLKNLIHKVINDPNKITSLEEGKIKNCLEKVIPIFYNENTLINLNGKVGFIGDTHGDFNTTISVIKRFFYLDHLVFLGDYIDREPTKWGSIYNITYLFLLKCHYPEKIILLKGNHECNYIIPCYPYEFEDEIVHRFGSSKLHSKFTEVFSLMPLMVKSEYIFASHGGIIKKADLNHLEKIGKKDKKAIESLVWSDPVISSTFRGAGKPFDEEDLLNFLENINSKVFIRGHDHNLLGFSIYRDKCLTVSTSSSYKNMGNGGILVARTEKNVNHVSDLIVEDFSSGKWLKYRVKKK